MNLYIRVEVRVDANVDILIDVWTNKWMENQITVSCHAKSRYNKNEINIYNQDIQSAQTKVYTDL